MKRVQSAASTHIGEESLHTIFLAILLTISTRDYLRRSGTAGFLVPLSGGIDSCSTATLVFSMTRIVMAAINEGNEQVIEDVRRIAGAYESKDWLPKTPQEISNRILHTVYMGMKTQSSAETRSRAERLAKDIGAYHTGMYLRFREYIMIASNLFQILTSTTFFKPKSPSSHKPQASSPSLKSTAEALRRISPSKTYKLVLAW